MYNNICSLDPYSRDLRTKKNFSLYTQLVFTQDCFLNSRVLFTHYWPNSNWITVACCVLPFISPDHQSDECTWRRMLLTSRNLYKCKLAAGIVVVVACFYPVFLYCSLLLVVYYLIPFYFFSYRPICINLGVILTWIRCHGYEWYYPFCGVISESNNSIHK